VNVRPSSFEDDLSLRIREIIPEMLFIGSTVQDFQQWQALFRKTFVALLGNIPIRTPLKPMVLERTVCDGYVMHRIQYCSEADVAVPAYLLIPDEAKKEPCPGLLCLHGHHDSGKESIVGRGGGSSSDSESSEYASAFAKDFVLRGYVVLAPDLRGFGERCGRYQNVSLNGCNDTFFRALLLGTTVTAFQLCDLFAGIDMLSSLDLLKKGSIGCVGFEYGAFLTVLLSALDPRIRVAAVSECMVLFKEYFYHSRWCPSPLIPGLIQFGDMPELFSLIAPRPLVVEYNASAPDFSPESVEEISRRVKHAYGTAGKEEHFFIDLFEGKDRFSGDLIQEVCSRFLKTS